MENTNKTIKDLQIGKLYCLQPKPFVWYIHDNLLKVFALTTFNKHLDILESNTILLLTSWEYLNNYSKLMYSLEFLFKKQKLFFNCTDKQLQYFFENWTLLS